MKEFWIISKTKNSKVLPRICWKACEQWRVFLDIDGRDYRSSRRDGKSAVCNETERRL